MRPALAALALLAVTAMSCDTSEPDGLSGRYELALRTDGDVVGRGTLDVQAEPINAVDESRLGGTWEVTRTVGGRATTSTGDLVGFYRLGAVRLTLTVPGLADAGFDLTGTVDGDAIRGEWTRGMSSDPAGTFTAER